MKKIILFLMLLSIPFSVKADEQYSGEHYTSLYQSGYFMYQGYACDTYVGNSSNSYFCEQAKQKIESAIEVAAKLGEKDKIIEIINNDEVLSSSDKKYLLNYASNVNSSGGESSGGESSGGESSGGESSGGESSGGTIGEVKPVDCNDIYGGELGDWIKNVFQFAKYVGLVLLVILTTMDFIKVVAGEKDDQIKSAFGSFVKRCIAVVLLFLTPVLIDFVFGLLGDNIKGSDGTNADVCIDYIK